MNMLSFMPYIWITVAVLSLIIEAASLYYTAICFLPAALVALTLSLTGFTPYIQVVFFLLVVALLIIIRFTILREWLNSNRKDVNPEALIDMNAIVVEIIDNLKNTGKIKIKGRIYKAIPKESNKIYNVGVMVKLIEYKTDEDTFICN